MMPFRSQTTQFESSVTSYRALQLNEARLSMFQLFNIPYYIICHNERRKREQEIALVGIQWKILLKEVANSLQNI